MDDINPLHRLAWIGEHGVGALTYKPVIDAIAEPLLTTIDDATALPVRAEAKNFKDIPRKALRAGGSAFGARPKFWAWRRQNQGHPWRPTQACCRLHAEPFEVRSDKRRQE